MANATSFFFSFYLFKYPHTLLKHKINFIQNLLLLFLINTLEIKLIFLSLKKYNNVLSTVYWWLITAYDSTKKSH